VCGSCSGATPFEGDAGRLIVLHTSSFPLLPPPLSFEQSNKHILYPGHSLSKIKSWSVVQCIKYLIVDWLWTYFVGYCSSDFRGTLFGVSGCVLSATPYIHPFATYNRIPLWTYKTRQSFGNWSLSSRRATR
jgi:hypothetical protein